MNPLVIGSIIFLQACSIHYYDTETQAEHIIGVGHMVMKIQEAGKNNIATIQGYSTLGLSAGTDQDGGNFSFGWSRNQKLSLLKPESAIELYWPNNDFLNLRIGDPFAGNSLVKNPNLSQDND